MKCPACGGEEWRLASVIFTGGLSTSSSTGFGVGTEGNNLGLGFGKTKGMNQTELSKSAAPPAQIFSSSKVKHPAFKVAMWSLIIAVLGNLSVGPGGGSFSESPILSVLFKAIPFAIFVISLLAVLLVPYANREAEEKYRQDMLEYKKTKMCLRCGTFYVDNSYSTFNGENIKTDSFATYSENGKTKTPAPIISEAATSSESINHMKKCPYCAELVLADAILCRYCRSNLSDNNIVD